MSFSVELKNNIWKDYLDVGKCTVGTKLPTVSELAARYKVSTPTIGKAIAILASEGWVTKRKGSGIYVADVTVPGRDDNNGAGRRQRKIGYIAGEISIALGQHALQGVEYVARKNNVVLEFASTNNDVEEEKRQITAMRERGVHGIVLYPAYNRGPGPEFLATDFLDYPIIAIDIYDESMKRPHLLFDNFTAGREMTQYLIGQGHKDIAFLRFDIHPHRTVDDRIDGYRRALLDAGIAFNPELLIETSTYRPEQGPSRYLKQIEQILAMNPRPTAIIAFYDMVVPEMIICLEHMGVSVPGDITVVGFDNLMHDYRNDWPTTNPDFVRMGERAAEMLLERIESKDCSLKETCLPCPLLVPNKTSGIIRPVAPLQAKRSVQQGV